MSKRFVFLFFFLVLFPLAAFSDEFTNDWNSRGVIDQAFSRDLPTANKGWQQIAQDLEKASKIQPDDIDLLRELLVAYTQVLCLQNHSVAEANLCLLIPDCIAKMEASEKPLTNIHKQSIVSARAMLYFKTGLYPLVIEELSQKHASPDLALLNDILKNMNHHNFSLRESFEVPGELLDYEVSVYDNQSTPPSDTRLFYETYFVTHPAGNTKMADKIWYGLASQQVGSSKRYYFYGHAEGSKNLLMIYGAQKPSYESVKNFVTTKMTKDLKLPAGMTLTPPVTTKIWLYLTIGVTPLIVLCKIFKRPGAVHAVVIVVISFSFATGIAQQDNQEASVRPEDPELAGIFDVFKDVESVLKEAGISIHGEDEKEEVEETDPVKDDVPKDDLPLPIVNNESNDSVTVNVPIKGNRSDPSTKTVEYKMLSSIMLKIIKSDINTVDLVRTRLAEAVVAGKVSEAMGEKILESFEQLSRSSEAFKRNRKNLNIDPTANLRRLKYTAKHSEIANSTRGDSAKALARQAFTIKYNEVSTSGNVVYTPVTHFYKKTLPPSISTPRLQESYRFKLKTVAFLAPTVAVNDTGATFKPKGVKILIDESMLARVLSQQSRDNQLIEMIALEEALLGAKNIKDVFIKLQTYTESKKSAFIEKTRHFKQINNVRVVSLKELYLKLLPYKNRWDERPEELRYLGGLTRIYGFTRDPKTRQLSLVGQAESRDPKIKIDDFSIGLKTVWKKGLTPGCSLDPNPADISGPQYSRIWSVPKDSSFAKIMLNADYQMKGITAGAPGYLLNIPGYTPIKDQFEFLGTDNEIDIISRFWLFPVTPNDKDIQLGIGGTSAFFDAKVKVLTESLVMSERGLDGTGQVHPVGQRQAAMFTQHYHQIAEKRSVFKQLEALFDIVVLSKILRLISSEDPLLEQWAQLPYSSVNVKKNYNGITVKHNSQGREIIFTGGCDVRARARTHNMIEAQTQGLNKFENMMQKSTPFESGITHLGSALSIPTSTDTGTEGLAQRAYAQGTTLSAKGQHEAAEHKFSEAIDHNAQFSQAYAQRALTRFILNRKKEALWDAGKAIHLDPEDPSLRAIMHRLLYEAGLAQYVGAPNQASKTELAIGYWLTGNRKTLQNRHKEAIKDYDTSIQFDSGLAFVYADLAVALYYQDKFIEVIKNCDKALTLDKVLVPAHITKGMAYFRLSKYIKAIESYTMALANDPKNPLALSSRASAKREIDDFAGSEEDAQAALTIQPNNTAALIVRGNTYLQKKQYKSAQQIFAQVIEICLKNPTDPQFPRAYTNRGMVKAQLGDLVGSTQDYNKALKIKPDHTNALVNRGNNYLRVRDFKAALPDFRAALKSKPVKDRVIIKCYVNCAAIQMSLSETEPHYAKQYLYKALEDIDEGIRLCRASDSPYLNRAESLREVIQTKLRNQ